MSTTDRQLLSEIQSSVIEVVDGGVTWASGLWTAQEVLAYINQRQNRFLKETYLLGSLGSISVPGGTLRPSLPNDWIATIHATWRMPSATPTLGTTFPLVKADVWEADNGLANWTTTGATPLLIMDAETPTLVFQLAPIPAADGYVDLIYVGLAATLTGQGELMTLPDEFIPYIKWGTLADMLGKAGRGQDLKRSAYCESRFDEGVEVAKLLMEGWS